MGSAEPCEKGDKCMAALRMLHVRIHHIAMQRGNCLTDVQKVRTGRCYTLSPDLDWR